MFHASIFLGGIIWVNVGYPTAYPHLTCSQLKGCSSREAHHNSDKMGKPWLNYRQKGKVWVQFFLQIEPPRKKNPTNEGGKL